MPFCVMNIPEQVKDEARVLIEQYGESFDYLGNHEGQEVYMFKFPADSDTGFPFVYWYKDGNVFVETGFSALESISLFVKD